MTVFLEAERLSKTYRSKHRPLHQVVRDVSLQITAGETVCLLGASGSGKTTLLRILANEEEPDHGKVRSLITRPGPAFGYLSQNDRLIPWRSAGQNVALGLELLGTSQKNARLASEEMLARVGLSASYNQRPKDLSGGMQQRTLIARLLALNPKLLLLDEPMSSLDVPARRDIAKILRNHARENGAGILVVTHSVEEACFLADRILLVTSAPAELFKEINIEDTPEERASAFETVMNSLLSAISGEAR